MAALRVVLALAFPWCAASFASARGLGTTSSNAARKAVGATAMAATSAPSSEDPLLLRTARGEAVERPPVWMMRQAGRHMQCYRDLVKKYPTFRERSEIAEVALEISLQPWKAYGVDGVILFSDILTPLPGMGVEFDIAEKEGPKLPPLRTQEQIDKIVHQKDWAAACPFVGSSLKALREEVGNSATVLGFVGLPYTLATYLVEGGSSKEYVEIKRMGFEKPELLHQMLTALAENIGDYANYQIESGAQIIQVFDSWAGHLSPIDYDIFAAPYQRMVIEAIKKKHPEVPVIIYINKSGALLERMASVGADIVSVDWTVDLTTARKRMGDKVGLQGNLDPTILLSSHETIKARTHEILDQTKDAPLGHVMNLGHGIDATTPEANAKFFVDTVQAYRW